MQPGRYELLDASAGALEDWPADNRVTAWVRLLRCASAAALNVALGQGLSEFPDPGAGSRARERSNQRRVRSA
ncbi:MAG: hypothetical protein OXH37_09345, partial [Gammaproteobacteria bacterium]|nr:hypothetical protein [Gammaproteobacteria bacterium]